MEIAAMGIRWRAVISGVCLYIIFITLVAALVIGVAGESIAPVTDLVITVLVLLGAIYFALRQAKGAEVRNGLVAGVGCAFISVVYNVITDEFELLQFFFQLVAFAFVGLIAGLLARRL